MTERFTDIKIFRNPKDFMCRSKPLCYNKARKRIGDDMANWRELKNRRWVVGVSGGADSMALLAMCLEKQLDVIVAHVNYQKRATANRDMMCVVNFCKAHDVMCHVRIAIPIIREIFRHMPVHTAMIFTVCWQLLIPAAAFWSHIRWTM